MKQGDTAFLVESSRFVREVTVVRNSNGLCLIRFKDTGGGIQVRENRLFSSKEEAEQTIPTVKKEKTMRSPYDFEH